MTDKAQAASLAEVKERVRHAIDALQDELIAVSMDIHANPELAFQEVRASRLLAAKLRKRGLEPTCPAFGLDTALVCEFGPAGTPCVGILAEYDALPDLGHACGHNIIATAALGAALGLAALGESLSGRVRLLGTPAEESGGGKILMAAKGAFDGLDCAMMVHPAEHDLPSYPLIARAAVRATYRGRAAHASSSPEYGVNALDGLVLAYQAIASWRQHMPPGHRVHGIIVEGGSAANIIADRAVGEFGVRAPDRAGLATTRRRIEECLRAGALASGCEVSIDWDVLEYHELKANWPLAHRYQANAEALGRTFARIEDVPASRAASTDFGNVSQIVPAIHPMIAAVPASVAFHTPEFAHWTGSDMGMKAMLDGAKTMAMTALDYIGDERFRAEVKTNFSASAVPEPAAAPSA